MNKEENKFIEEISLSILTLARELDTVSHELAKEDNCVIRYDKYMNDFKKLFNELIWFSQDGIYDILETYKKLIKEA